MSNFFNNGKGAGVFFLMRSPDDICGNMIGKPPSKFSYQFSLVEEKNQTGRRGREGGRV